MIGGKSDTMTHAFFAALLAGTAPVATPAEPAVSAPVADEAPAGDILVTARRRTESVQDVPVAISVLGGEALEQKGAYQLQQIYQEVPSLTVYTSNPRNVTINIRGLGSNVATANNGLDLGVGFYVDDVYYARVGQSGFDLVDLDRIEILRGPQGTLFGRNTTAGAIVVSTRKPTFETEASGDVTIGNFGLFQGRGSVSGAIGDKVAGRLSFEATRRDGFLYNTYQKRRVHDFQNYSVRGQLLFTPGDNLTVRFIGDYAEQQQNCCVPILLGTLTNYDNGAAIPYNYAQRTAQFGYNPPLGDPRDRITDSDWLGPIRMKQGGVQANVEWDLGPATLTSVTAFRFWHWTPRNDPDYSALNISLEGNQYDRQRQVSQELRLASNGKRTIDWVVGLYAFHQSINGWFRNEYGRDAGEFLIAPGTAGLTPAQRRATLEGTFTYAPSKPETDSYAAFGQGVWHLTPAIDLTVGLRYTQERKYGFYEQVRGGGSPLSTLNPAQIALRNAYTPVYARYTLDRSWGDASGLVSLSGRLGADALVYVTYARGQKSGGLNFATLPLASDGTPLLDLAVVAPEKVDNYEVGWKSEWFERRLTANLSAFLTDVSNYQSTIVDASVVPPRAYIANVGDVRSYGVEGELRARPIDGLSLYASATWNPAEYRRYTNAQCPFEQRAPGQPTVCDLSGRQLPAAPRWAWAAGGSYDVPVNDRVTAFAGADYAFRSSFYTSYNLSRFSLVDGFGLANARVGVRSADGKWEASLWARNLFDTLTYYTRGISENGAVFFGLTGDPRTVGLTLRTRL
ncbi:TonB-dependent receptor [Sphingomonas adhaesiva]|uniref:TonB-dependent receptor n=1 Tax=Sphingomonas adhaesiva TaxID=28212 RepID=UPI002FF51247